jgi:hypothetical protein
MSEHAGAEASPTAAGADTISIPWVLLSAVMCGVGLFAVSYWLLTQNWLWFLGILPVILGAIMFLSPRMGPDHA